MGALGKVLGFPFEVWALLVTWLPGPVGRYLRVGYWRRRLRHLGEGSVIDVGVYIQGAEHVSIGANTWIDRHVHILAGPPAPGRLTHHKENPDFDGGPGEVRIGDNSHIAAFAVLSGLGGIRIGDCTTVAAGAKIYSYSHHYRNLDDPDDRCQYSFTSKARTDQQALISGPVVVGDHAAVGLGSIVLPGVTIGRGAWLACGSVLRRNLEDQTLASSSGELSVKRLDLEIRS